MRRWAVAVSCVLVLGGSSSGLAQQQQTGPRTLEGLLNSGEAQAPTATAEAAKADAADAGPKRPAGTVARPKDGVQHPDLDKAWAEYDAAVSTAAESIRAAINKQFDAATAKGDLDEAEKWQGISEKFRKSGELPSASETKAVVSASVATYKKAKDELGNAYEAIVKTLTIDKKIVEAKAFRGEWSVVGSLEQQAAKQAKAEPRADHKVWLSDLQERNAFVGYGSFGKNGELGYEGLKIVVGGKGSQKGISIHPPSNGTSRVTYDVPADCTHFEGQAAIADGRSPQLTPVVFRVLNERGDVLWASRPIRGAGASEKCRVALKGAKAVTLTVDCPGSYNFSYAVWVDPIFCR